MRIRVVREYEFVTEILPPLTIGILLNMVGRYAGDQLREYFVVRQIFLDLAGSAFVAIMIGPWWAATAAIIGSAINSQLFFNFFPFGVKNVIGSLAWGYFASRYALRYRLTENKPTISEVVRIFVAFTLVGAVACAVTTFLIKLALYPPMLRPLTYGETYQLLLRSFALQEGTWIVDAVVLFIGDCIREGVDKAIEGAVAILAVCAVRAVPSGLISTQNRWRVDALSIFSFTVAYGFYLLVARITQPSLAFVGAQRSVEWMQYPSMIGLFYMPMGVALLAFLLLTYEPDSALGRSVEVRRMNRAQIYRRLVSVRSWWLSPATFPQQLSKNTALRPIFGLIGSVAAWPTVTKPTTGVIINIVYFGLTSAIVLLYIHRNRALVRQYRRARDALAHLWDWLTVPPARSGESLLSTLSNMLTDQYQASRSKVMESNGLTYKLLFVGHKTRESDQTEAIDLIADVNASVILVAVVGGDKVIDQEARLALDMLLDNVSPSAAIVVSLTPAYDNPELQQWLIRWGQRRVRIWVLNWYELARAVSSGRVDDLARAFAEIHVRLLESRTGGRAMQETGLADLAQRTLPTLAHIIDNLPRNSVVYDLGAGRGRHTLYALLRGHVVHAMDRRADAVSDLRTSIAALGDGARQAKVIHGDYLEAGKSEAGGANLVIGAGILQHCRGLDELRQRLELMAKLADEPNAMVFIEMLFDMTFDGAPPADGRLRIARGEFEDVLAQTFGSDTWTRSRLAGPTFRRQDFVDGPRSFYPTGRIVESTSVEYLLTRFA